MQKAGKYEIVRKIGAGGFGVVYEGRDPFIKRRVAIKTCTTEDEEIRQRFYREAEIAGNLQHKNIVTIHDFGIEEGVPYLVQEYLTGEDLEHVIARGAPIALERKLDILIQVAHGMDHAHAAGVIHRDIKPANVRLLDDGRVKILDFGIAKLAHVESRLTKEGMTVGTAAYLPPEQIRGEKIDFRSDVFSFGVLAYELLAMVRPFDGKTLSTLLFQILSQVPRPLAEAFPGAPPRLAALVDSCLDKEVAKRCASFAEVSTELEATLAELPADDGAAAAGATLILSKPEVDPRAALQPLVEQVRRALAAGDLTTAEIEIGRARENWGSQGPAEEILAPLGAEVARERERRDEQRRRESRLRELIDTAAAEMGAARPERAAELARQALAVDAGSAEARRLLDEAEAAVRLAAERERLRREAEALARAEADRAKRHAAFADEIDGAIAQAAFARAEKAIARAEAELGAGAFEDRRRRLTERRDAALEAERREAERLRLEREESERRKAAEDERKRIERAEAERRKAEEAERRRAEARAAAERREAEARAEAEKRRAEQQAAAERKAAAARAAAERREVEAKAAAEKREAERQAAAEAAREKALRQAAAKVEQRLAAGDLARARRELDKALAGQGDAAPLAALASRLAAAEAESASERQRLERERADRERAAALEATTGSAVPSGSFASPGSSMSKSGRRVAGLAAAAGIAGVALVSWLVFGRGDRSPTETGVGPGAEAEVVAASPATAPAGSSPLATQPAAPESRPATDAAPPPSPAIVSPAPEAAPEEADPVRPVEASPTRPEPYLPAPAVDPSPVVERPAPVAPPIPEPTATRPEARPEPAPPIEERPEPAPSAPAEVRPEPVPAADPTVGVRAALERYRAAYQALDAAAVQAAWPGLDANARRQIARAFEGYHSIAMSLEDCRYEVEGERATARCRVTQTIDVKVGRDLESTQDVVFGLRRAGAGWVIQERTAR
ncbi:MAG: hypothetical protein AMXMBFR36_30320 [Acidobacteriota bacterium]